MCTGFWLTRSDESVPLATRPSILCGLFYIQEASSMLPVMALFASEQTGDGMLLDRGRRPWLQDHPDRGADGKPRHADRQRVSSSRLKVLSANIQRCGVTNVGMTHFDAKVFGQWLPETFDAILLDAPCSGEGRCEKMKTRCNWVSRASTRLPRCSVACWRALFTPSNPAAYWSLHLHPEPARESGRLSVVAGEVR